MAATIRIMSWNLAGAKLLDRTDSGSTPIASSYTSAYQSAWHKAGEYLDHTGKCRPDIILLQECIGFIDRRPKKDPPIWQTGEEILEEIFDGYAGFFFSAISSVTNPHPTPGSGTSTTFPRESKLSKVMACACANPQP